MEYDDYLKFFKAFFAGKTYSEIFEEGRVMLKALHEAEHQAAAEDWYGGGGKGDN